MLRTFIIGIVLGITGVIAALHLLPAVDQARESSLITVAPNGGNLEAFHVNIPMDRIMVGAPGQTEPLPPELEWPEDPMLSDARAELFKLRNSRDAVVGVASRIAARDDSGDVVEWVLHLGGIVLGADRFTALGWFSVSGVLVAAVLIESVRRYRLTNAPPAGAVGS